MRRDDRAQHGLAPRGRRDRRGWLGGAALGCLLGIGMTAAAQDNGDTEELVLSVIYAISALAVDTETNAARIEALSQKISDLEDQLKASQPQ